jgi:hypothetical protein
MPAANGLGQRKGAYAARLAGDSVSSAYRASALSVPRSFSQTLLSRSRRDTRARALR